MKAALHTYTNDKALLTELTDFISTQLKQAIAARGHAYFVVSGGRTPIPLFEQLSHTELPWHQVTVLLADERWVPLASADSNERLVRENLLQNLAASAQFTSLLTDDVDAYAAQATVNTRLSALPTFDVVILGMGEDGHTASIFPCSDEVDAALTSSDSAIAVSPKSAPNQRMSLTRQRLLDSRQLILHLRGHKKADVLTEAERDDSARDMPIRAFLQQTQVPMDVFLALV